MNPILRNFYANESERDAVKAFMIEQLALMAIDRSFAGESVVGIKEARELVDKSFDKLEQVYGIIKKPKEQNSR